MSPPLPGWDDPASSAGAPQTSTPPAEYNGGRRGSSSGGRDERGRRRSRNDSRGRSRGSGRESRRRSRSRDRGSRRHRGRSGSSSGSESPRSSRSRSRSRRRHARKSGWDDETEQPETKHSNFSSAPPDGSVDPQQLLLQQAMISGGAGANKKAKELYVGNLAQGQATQANIRAFFNNALSALPEYQQKYAALLPTGAVREVRMSAEGMYAFVEVASEEIAVTCLELDKAEFLGRPLKIGRPTGLVLPGPAPPPMDVSVLRNQGFLPTKAMPSNPSQSRKQRELYVGNLAIGVVTAQVLHELFEPACKVLPDYDPALGPPVLQADIRGDGRFAFVEFQNDRLATAALSIFNGMEVLGRRLIVSRPQGFVEGGAAAPAGLPGSTGQQWNALPQQAGMGGWGMTASNGGQGWGGAQPMLQQQAWGAGGFSDNANVMPVQNPRSFGGQSDGQDAAARAGAEAAQALLGGGSQ